MLFLFRSFTVGPGYATNCKFVPTSCSSVAILVLAIFVLRYLYFILSTFSQIASTCLYVETFDFLANRLNVHSCCGVFKSVVFIYMRQHVITKFKSCNSFPECDNFVCVTGFIDATLSRFSLQIGSVFSQYPRRENLILFVLLSR